jgi:hypothetical protein
MIAATKTLFWIVKKKTALLARCKWQDNTSITKCDKELGYVDGDWIYRPQNKTSVNKVRDLSISWPGVKDFSA